MNAVDPPPHALPRPYLAWLAGFTVARLGDAVLAFALGWAAAGLGGTAAALVLTAGGVPRLVLLVLGGAVADRVGARRLLIAGEATALATTALVAAALARSGPATWTLVASSLALGTVTAFCLPATGSMPRRLVPDDQLARALALRQGAGQALLLVAAPLGGVLVGGVGLPAVAWGTAVTTGVSLWVLVAVREVAGAAREAAGPVREPAGPVREAAGAVREAAGSLHDDVPGDRPGAASPGLGLLDGVRVAGRTPGLRRALVLTGATAGLALPVPSLLVPLLGRASGWGPGATGAVAGAVGVGALGAALLAARRRAPRGTAGAATPTRGAAGSGTAAGRARSGRGARRDGVRRPVLPRLGGRGFRVQGLGARGIGGIGGRGLGGRGLALSALGVAVLAAAGVLGGSGGVGVAVAGALVLGTGNGVVAARLAPVVLGSTPRTHLARVQAIVGLAQLVPVLVTTTALGALAEHASPGWALAVTATGLVVCTAWAGREPAGRA